jgi:regulatory protein
MSPPDAGALHAAALRHLSRYAATAAGLTQVLDRRIKRWADAALAEGADRADVDASANAARQAARTVVERLVQAGAVDDAGFAAARAARLARTGRSRRAAAAHLAARGIDEETARAALSSGPANELASALVLARRRRIGPFRAGPAPVDAESRRRELAIFARAGFPRDIAERVLETSADDARELVAQLLW